MPADSPNLEELLGKLIAVDGSDLHLKVGSPPVFRIDGSLTLSNLPKLTSDDTRRYANELLPEHLKATFDEHHEADFAFGRQTLGRFRVNIYRQRGSVSIAMRSVMPASKNFTELGLPTVLADMAKEKRGLILVTGPTGAGKSTTLAAVVDEINSTRRVNIITLEDPIEVLHPDKMAIVSQREVGVDTLSFSEALRRILRQDPDVVLIGEMRDAETVDSALKAAETGHLVLSTLHTIDATETINRIIDFFPAYQQKQIRLLLASSLRGIVSQRLLQRTDGNGRTPAVEVFVNTERAHDRIVDPEKTHELIDVIADGEFYGMQSFDQSLMDLYQRGIVSFADAVGHSTNPADFKLHAQNRGLKAS
ncbi:MAG: PilT/PilU family type 4a pilus ATPase [Acidimicrobiia bacterium]|nr:PilT/PilU family type 4a pilus ATPase [Acidimicrobiia bacterium]